MEEVIKIYADGGARGNPGPAAIGFVVRNSLGKIIHKEGKYIGETTNNVAEYKAVIESLKWMAKNRKMGKWKVESGSQIKFFLDSQLIVNQLNGFYKVKEPKMRNLIVEVRQLERQWGDGVSYQLIPRKKNFLADSLVNQTLNHQTTSIS